MRILGSQLAVADPVAVELLEDPHISRRLVMNI